MVWLCKRDVGAPTYVANLRFVILSLSLFSFDYSFDENVDNEVVYKYVKCGEITMCVHVKPSEGVNYRKITF